MESTNLALRMTNSGNAEAHHNLVRHIFQTLGIKADPFSVIHSFQGQNTPSVGVSVYHPHDKKAGLYAAANLGLLSDQPGQLVFHPASHGQDWLHSIRLKGEAEQVGQALSGAGINQFHLVPMQGQDGPQFRAMIYDKGGTRLPALKDFAGQVGGEIYTQKGHGLVLGGANKTATNEAYRGVIRKLEGSQQPQPTQMSRAGKPLKKAAFAPPGQNQQLVVNLPEPVPNQPKQIDASQGPAMPSPEAVIKPMPGNQSTVLPYYAEAANGQV